MKKFIIGSVCGIVISDVYCADINVRFADGIYNSSDRTTLLFRHGNTGVSGHENYSMARVIPESLEESSKIGEVLRANENSDNLKFITDCSLRGNDTAKALSDKFFFRTSNDFLEVDLELFRDDYVYLNTQPHMLFAALKAFISNIKRGSKPENRANLAALKKTYGDNAYNILYRFVSIVNNKKFDEMSKKMRAIAKNSTFEKNIIIHHSIFISLMLYYTKLNEIYKCSNLLELRDKINYDLQTSPRSTYEKCLYILGNALARYRLKNLELLYLTVGKKNGIYNLQICDYDYIRDNDLYLSKSIALRKKTCLKDKLKGLYELCINKLEQVSCFTNIKDVVKFMIVKDTIQRKNVRLSITYTDSKCGSNAKKNGFLQSALSFFTLPIRWIRGLHSYDDCL